MKKDAEPTTKDRLPSLSLMEEVGCSQRRGYIAVGRLKWRRSSGRESQLRQVVQAKTGHRRDIEAIARRWREVHVPPKPISNSQVTVGPPSIFRENAKVAEQ